MKRNITHPIIVIIQYVHDGPATWVVVSMAMFQCQLHSDLATYVVISLVVLCLILVYMDVVRVLRILVWPHACGRTQFYQRTLIDENVASL